MDKHNPHFKMLLQQFGYLLVTFFVLWSHLVTGSHACSTAGIVYSRDQLIALRSQTPIAGESPTVPRELKRRRRGCRAGVKRRRKIRKFKPCIPAVITGNVRSLANKMDELEALARTHREYRESSVMCFTETWLHEQIPDSNATIPGFHTVRADRDTAASGKKKGGGLAVLVNNRWCHPGHISVKERFCSPDIELIAIGLRPYYLPREFTSVIAITVYIPPSGNADAACDVIHATTAALQTKYPGAFVIITGDFNHVSLSSTLPTFHQFVKCTTRDNKTIDLLYANVKDAYSSTALPPLGRSDHNLVLLSPSYKPVIQQLPVTVRTVRKWSPEAMESLQGALEATDWEALYKPHGEDIDGITDCVSEYIGFCMDNTIPTKEVRCYPNNKPWVTSDLKALLNEKKRAFRSGDRAELKRVQRELKHSIRESKEKYRRKLEFKLENNNTRDVWRGMREITGFQRRGGGTAEGNVQRANEFNLFFNRFDSSSPSSPPAAAPLSNQFGTQPPHNPTAPQPHTIPRSEHQLSPPPSPPPPTSLLAPSTDLLTPPSPRTRELPPLLPSSSHHSALPPTPQTGLNFTASQVRRELERLNQRKAAGPDRISPRVLKACAGQLCGVLQHLFNLSLHLQRVPVLWKTSCLVPVPKKGRPVALNDYRPIALTSHIMKVMERLVLAHLRPLVGPSQDPLQFAYQPHVGVDDAIIYLLQEAYSSLDRPNTAVRIMFFDFSSAFNTIQPKLLKAKLENMRVDSPLVTWVDDYLTGRPQFVRLQNCVSDRLIGNIGAPQGTVLSPFLFTTYTADFKYRTESCHLQKFSDDTAIVGRVEGGGEEEYRNLVGNFVKWCGENHLQLNVTKTKEMVVDFRRNKPPPSPVCIGGSDVDIVDSYKYLGVVLDNKLEWTTNTEAVYKKGLSRLYFLRRLRSFNVCNRMLQMFYESVVASTIFFAVVSWGAGIKAKDANRLNKLIKKAGSVVGSKLVTLEEVAEDRMLAKLLVIMDNVSHPLHETLDKLKSSFSSRLIHPRCLKERHRKSFLPGAVRLYNASQKRPTATPMQLTYTT